MAVVTSRALVGHSGGSQVINFPRAVFLNWSSASIRITTRRCDDIRPSSEPKAISIISGSVFSARLTSPTSSALPSSSIQRRSIASTDDARGLAPAACARMKTPVSFMRRRSSPNNALLPEPGSPVTQMPQGAPSIAVETQRSARGVMTACLPTKSRARSLAKSSSELRSACMSSAVLLTDTGRDCDIVDLTERLIS